LDNSGSDKRRHNLSQPIAVARSVGGFANRFRPTCKRAENEKHFEIDDKRVADDARYDGLYVLRTNTTLSPLAAMLRYRELLKVEDIFRTTKSILDTRPIYHQKDAAIRGHVFCSFLALVLRLRTPVTGDVGRAFQAVGVALTPNIREADAVASTQ
jgi:hypothetical protein